MDDITVGWKSLTFTLDTVAVVSFLKLQYWQKKELFYQDSIYLNILLKAKPEKQKQKTFFNMLPQSTFLLNSQICGVVFFLYNLIWADHWLYLKIGFPSPLLRILCLQCVICFLVQHPWVKRLVLGRAWLHTIDTIHTLNRTYYERK